MNGAQIIYSKALKYGMSVANIYSGGAVMSLVDQFHPNLNYGKIKHIVHTHEQNCGHAATGYAKASGKTGLCIVTSGPC